MSIALSLRESVPSAPMKRQLTPSSAAMSARPSATASAEAICAPVLRNPPNATFCERVCVIGAAQPLCDPNSLTANFEP